MPSLPTITFTASSTDAFPPTCSAPGTFNLYMPASHEAILNGTTSYIDLHLSGSFPEGYTAVISPDVYNDISGAANCALLPYTYPGPGAFPIRVSILNFSGSDITAGTIAEGTLLGRLTVFKTPDIAFALAGTWA